MMTLRILAAIFGGALPLFPFSQEEDFACMVLEKIHAENKDPHLFGLFMERFASSVLSLGEFGDSVASLVLERIDFQKICKEEARIVFDSLQSFRKLPEWNQFEQRYQSAVG